VLVEQVIADGSLRTVDGGFAFDVRLPWYRALPLACVEGLDVALDGHTVPSEELRIEFNGRAYALGELPPLHEDWWYVADAAPVTAPLPEPLGPGDHQLDVTIHVRIPYIIESGVPLVMREHCVKTQRAQEVVA
jgi:Domain of unknown function (DUF6379)